MEIVSPSQGSGYKFRYTPPFRATLRPPLEDAAANSPDDLSPIYEDLKSIAERLSADGGRHPGSTAGPPVNDPDPLGPKLVRLGDMLLKLVVPEHVQADLRSPDLFLEIGTDEALLDLPWELIHDGEDHLCLKSLIGRFVNLTKPSIRSNARRSPVFGVELDRLRVLVISVPNPDPRTTDDGKEIAYRPLESARVETDAITDTLAHHPEVQLRILLNAKWRDVYDALNQKDRQYYIIHYNGHADSNVQDPKSSALVLQDRNMVTGQVTNLFRVHPPIFCFMNACETTMIPAARAGARSRQYSLYGLGSAFLETGAYLLGSCWKIRDETAARFGQAFYSSFLEGGPIGRAVREARLAVKDDALPDDLGWASYTFYGDPRLLIRKMS